MTSYLCRDINDIPHTVDETNLSEHHSVYAIIRNSDGVLPVAQTDHKTHRFEFPGGGVEADESISDALRREVLEETGLAIDVIGDKICELVDSTTIRKRKPAGDRCEHFSKRLLVGN